MNLLALALIVIASYSAPSEPHRMRQPEAVAIFAPASSDPAIQESWRLTCDYFGTQIIDGKPAIVIRASEHGRFLEVRDEVIEMIRTRNAIRFLIDGPPDDAQGNAE